MRRGILSVIGNTPLIRLERFFKTEDFHLYAKLESLNPGGSMKDRPAISIIEHGIKTGAIAQDTVIVESSSGNMGIGLAQACSYFGLRFICVVDPKTTAQNIRLLKAYGAEVEIVSERDAETGEYLSTRIKRVRSLVELFENSFWPDQYSNIHNPRAHHQTMQEIVMALCQAPDYLFCATSTCGTIRGCAEYIRQNNLSTRIIAVDAIGSVIFGGKKANRLVPGHGAAIRPALYQADLAAECVLLSDLDCVVGCRRLVRQESILAGGSSGAVLMAVDRKKQELPRGSLCVVILADRGERYLDTIYSDRWVTEHFGEVAHLWEEPVQENELAGVS